MSDQECECALGWACLWTCELAPQLASVAILTRLRSQAQEERRRAQLESTLDRR